jgi:hypothetical protein
MPTNLVSEIARVLGPDVEARIASSLGLDKTVVQGAVEGGVPGLLAALISLVSKPQGASKLGQAVAQQEPGVLSSLASVIGGSGQKALIDTGASALTSLLGGHRECAHECHRELRGHRRSRFKELDWSSRAGGFGCPGTAPAYQRTRRLRARKTPYLPKGQCPRCGAIRIFQVP